jgi:hypothetical protein
MIRLDRNTTPFLIIINVYKAFIFFGNPGCSGQLTRTTTNSRTH